MSDELKPQSSEGIHGGNLAWALATYGGVTADWCDLSTGINPHPYPFSEPPSTVWTELPSADGLTRATAAARSAYAVASRADVVAAPGTQSLIQLIPRLRTTTTVAVVSPTYAEHAMAWAQDGHVISEVTTLADALASANVVVVTNPNNPNGARQQRRVLLEACSQLAQHDGLLIVDEAFADNDERNSLAPYAAQSNLIVLRSFGKFYGLAGVRLGFALCDAPLGTALRRSLGPWPIAGATLAIGAQALADAEWRERMRARLLEDSTRLLDVLRTHGLNVIGSTSLFALAQHADAQRIWRIALEHKILLRRFPQQPQWLRFGLPRTAFDWLRLDEVLTDATDS